jgi:hypothetical protein
MAATLMEREVQDVSVVHRRLREKRNVDRGTDGEGLGPAAASIKLRRARLYWVLAPKEQTIKECQLDPNEDREKLHAVDQQESQDAVFFCFKIERLARFHSPCTFHVRFEGERFQLFSSY